MVMTASERARVLVRNTYCTLKIEIPNHNLVIPFFPFFSCVYISTLVDVGFCRHIGRCQVDGLQGMKELLVRVRLR